MKFLRKFNEHTSYEAEVNRGGESFTIPNVSYCKNVKDVHFNPYNLIKFYVGEITEPQTVKIYTDLKTSVNIEVSKGNKWYSCLLPKDKGLYTIKGNNSDVFSDDIITKVIVNANISYSSSTTYTPIIPISIIEAYFKGSNTSNITDMSHMFNFCSGLTSLDVRNFDTSKVTNMDDMFADCSGLTSLDLSRFNTSNVTSMIGMFSGCKGLTSLDVSNFNTSNVTTMYQMFHRCSNLTSLNLRNFNTSNVTDMSYMFSGCMGLTSLDVSNFNTSNVTDMNSMFEGCSNLKSLDLSRFNTIKVTNMTSMFSKCSGLALLDLSKWDTSSVTSMNGMFNGCSNLDTIRMIGCKQPTIDKIKERLTADGISLDKVNIITE